MATDAHDDLRDLLSRATQPGARSRLLARGLARALIWRDGELPEGAPEFTEGLTDDLLDFGYAVFAMALRLRAVEDAQDGDLLIRAFATAAEAIEAATHRGDPARLDVGFNRVSAAVAFHLARFAARSFSVLPEGTDDRNLAPSERALVLLMRRSLDDLFRATSDWLQDPANSDETSAQRLNDDPDYFESDAISAALLRSFMRALATFEHAMTSGSRDSAELAIERMRLTAASASDLHAPTHWWTATMAAHLLAESWSLSFHEQLPVLDDDDEGGAAWNHLRWRFINRLRAGQFAAVELWPSQTEAASRATNQSDDLVVALPTSAGKTRIAELCILRALSLDKRVVYVTPLRALSAQIERELATTFRPLGYSVSAMYGAAGVESVDTDILREGHIVVATPEKIDFALRNDPSLIDDVGLVVLDEGHMIGPQEREVRYEAFVQRLLRRGDAHERRIVCLSALFPTPDEMADLVAWLRQDEPGEPVHSTWRPTRQRFGVVKWNDRDAARLDVQVEDESPYVPRFIEAQPPPRGRRKLPFPKEKSELTLALASRFVTEGQRVLVYCARRVSVEPLGELALKCIRQRVLDPFDTTNEDVERAMQVGAEWIGEDHPAVQCLQHGIALHHGGLPRPFLNEVELLLKAGNLPLTVASPTLAQGLNIAASVLIVPTIWRTSTIKIPPVEFANVAGRAGRAFVDKEGLILHVVWGLANPEKRITAASNARWAVGQWDELVEQSRAPVVVSGILQLAYLIAERIAATHGIAVNDVVEHIAGNAAAWDRPAEAAVAADVWERDLASLDAALLSLIDADTAIGDLDDAIAAALAGSLYERQLTEVDNPDAGAAADGGLHARAHAIWAGTTAPQRKGYHTAGIGLAAGRFIDANLDALVQLLTAADDAILSDDPVGAFEAIAEFGELVLTVHPFAPPKSLPPAWRDELEGWLNGAAAADVIRSAGEGGVDVLHEALCYRLPWAMEAVRVHALALGNLSVEDLRGWAALALEAGSTNRSAITLIRAGLSSREAAAAAVTSTGATFTDRGDMLMWLISDEVQQLSEDPDWPTPRSHDAWRSFTRGRARESLHSWEDTTHSAPVEWAGDEPSPGTPIVIGSNQLDVMTIDHDLVGQLVEPFATPRRFIVDAMVDEAGSAWMRTFAPER